MDENYEDLFARIRAKCRQQRWHGPDISNPFLIVERERLRLQNERERIERLRKEYPTRKGWWVAVGDTTVYWHDRNGKQYAINAETDLENFPLQTDFEYPPATEEELVSAERYLGHPLPPLLRALYANVANGGFGPGYGLNGVRGSTSHARLAPGDSWKRRQRPIDFSVYLRKYGDQDSFEVPWYVWPESLLTLCH